MGCLVMIPINDAKLLSPKNGLNLNTFGLVGPSTVVIGFARIKSKGATLSTRVVPAEGCPILKLA